MTQTVNFRHQPEDASDSVCEANETARPVFLVATIRPWNIDAFHQQVKKNQGNWHLLSDPAQLTVDYVRQLQPRYIFFPHWSEMVPAEILALSECVCFHETDLPYGRGGSPIQNLIAMGHTNTVITALRMTDTLDAGPIYMKRPLSLLGSAEEIFVRAAAIVAEMMGEISRTHPMPIPQQGSPAVFKRRTPSQSEITASIGTLEQLYDHIRMLDAPEYPKAFLEACGFRMVFENARLDTSTNSVTATVTFTSSGAQTGTPDATNRKAKS